MLATKQKMLISLILIASLFVSLPALAQDTGTIKGQITDALGEPLIGANIYLEGTVYGAASDLDGAFVILDVPAGDYTIVVEYVGYRMQSDQVGVAMRRICQSKLQPG